MTERYLFDNLFHNDLELIELRNKLRELLQKAIISVDISAGSREIKYRIEYCEEIEKIEKQIRDRQAELLDRWYFAVNKLMYKIDDDKNTD